MYYRIGTLFEPNGKSCKKYISAGPVYYSIMFCSSAEYNMHSVWSTDIYAANDGAAHDYIQFMCRVKRWGKTLGM